MGSLMMNCDLKATKEKTLYGGFRKNGTTLTLSDLRTVKVICLSCQQVNSVQGIFNVKRH